MFQSLVACLLGRFCQFRLSLLIELPSLFGLLLILQVSYQECYLLVQLSLLLLLPARLFLCFPACFLLCLLCLDACLFGFIIASDGTLAGSLEPHVAHLLGGKRLLNDEVVGKEIQHACHSRRHVAGGRTYMDAHFALHGDRFLALLGALIAL